jgi:hypothetical protein
MCFITGSPSWELMTVPGNGNWFPESNGCLPGSTNHRLMGRNHGQGMTNERYLVD